MNRLNRFFRESGDGLDSGGDDPAVTVTPSAISYSPLHALVAAALEQWQSGGAIGDPVEFVHLATLDAKDQFPTISNMTVWTMDGFPPRGAFLLTLTTGETNLVLQTGVLSSSSPDAVAPGVFSFVPLDSTNVSAFLSAK